VLIGVQYNSYLLYTLLGVSGINIQWCFPQFLKCGVQILLSLRFRNELTLQMPSIENLDVMDVSVVPYYTVTKSENTRYLLATTVMKNWGETLYTCERRVNMIKAKGKVIPVTGHGGS
jgi:hypothetical protein